MLEVDGVGVTYQSPKGLMRLLVQSAAKAPVRAVDEVTFTVNRGEVLGLVGPNGAGKSTLLRAITSLLVPSDGSIRLDGELLDPDNWALRRRFGVCLPDDRSFHWRLTGRQNLRYFAALAGIPRPLVEQRVTQAMTEWGLAGRDKSVFGYSSGMLARLSIARALLHRPSLLVLDEPTRSLDPMAASDFCDEIRRVANDGRAVVFASHRTEDIVQTCDRVVMLIDGRIRWSGPASDLGADSSGPGRILSDLVADAERDEW